MISYLQSKKLQIQCDIFRISDGFSVPHTSDNNVSDFEAERRGDAQGNN